MNNEAICKKHRTDSLSPSDISRRSKELIEQKLQIITEKTNSASVLFHFGVTMDPNKRKATLTMVRNVDFLSCEIYVYWKCFTTKDHVRAYKGVILSTLKERWTSLQTLSVY